MEYLVDLRKFKRSSHGLSAPGTMNWQEQFRMMKRWYHRLEDTSGFWNEPMDFGHQDDFLIAFSIMCGRFRDWLVKEKVAKEKEIDAFIGSHDVLALCRDMGDFSNHAKLWADHEDSRMPIAGKKLVIMPSKSDQKNSPFFGIRTDRQRKEAYAPLELIERCLCAWENFLIAKGIRIPDASQKNFP